MKIENGLIVQKSNIVRPIYRWTVRRPSGYARWFEPDSHPSETERDTLQCRHCQYTWFVDPGSGKQRGWCTMCNGPTCGSQECSERCLPFERMQELIERSRGFAEAVGLSV